MLDRFRRTPSLAGRRVLVTGAARGIGAAIAERLHQRGARIALAGLEPELLAAVADRCGGAPWWECDVADRYAVQHSVDAAVEAMGGLDVAIANAGIAAQMPVVGGDSEILRRTLEVNVLGVHHTLSAAGPHLSHPQGYALATASLAAAVHVPLLGAYSASKAAVEALADTLRVELRPTGARVGVAYYAELDTDMTRRGFGTEAAAQLTGGRTVTTVTPLAVAIDALERGIALRARHVVAPWWVGPLLPMRMVAQRVVDVALQRRLPDALDLARREVVPFTTEQPPRP
jgi:NAD(P)-dependent dehydrogenase (short-subunit alcohol dehydrogenase family)